MITIPIYYDVTTEETARDARLFNNNYKYELIIEKSVVCFVEKNVHNNSNQKNHPPTIEINPFRKRRILHKFRNFVFPTNISTKFLNFSIRFSPTNFPTIKKNRIPPSSSFFKIQPFRSRWPRSIAVPPHLKNVQFLLFP